MFFGRHLEKKALDLIEAHRYDLDIMDVMLPDIDGFTLGKKLTANYPDLPFIFLTTRSLEIDVLKGFSLGAVEYLKKPIDEEELAARIQALLSRLHPTQIKQILKSKTFIKKDLL